MSEQASIIAPEVETPAEEAPEQTTEVKVPSSENGVPQVPAGEEPKAEKNVDDFLTLLPEEYQTDPTFSKFKSVEDLAKSYKNVEQLVGADKSQLFKIPKDGDLSEVYNALGRPEDVDGYGEVEGLDNESLNGYKELFHKHGASKALYDEIMAKVKADAANVEEQNTGQFQETISGYHEQIKKDLGDAFGERMGQIRALTEQYGDEEFHKVVNSNPQIFDHPAVVGFLAKIAPQFQEDGVPANGQGSGGRMTPAEAKMAIVKLESENARILMDKSHPKHEIIKAERDRLYKFKNA